MSRERIRPTRDETRRRLFSAASEVFARSGVGAATVEQIASAAGFSRGAVYSNFATKEELALAMLDDHLERSQARNRTRLAHHPGPAGFVHALRTDGGWDDPLHDNPLLQVELMLFVARKPELRERMGEHLRILRRLSGEIANATLRTAGTDLPVDTDQLGTILLALEDGLRLHRIIDPDSTSPDAFFDALDVLQRLVVRHPPT